MNQINRKDNPQYWNIENCPNGVPHDFGGGLKCKRCDVTCRMIVVRRSDPTIDSGWTENGRTVRNSILRRLGAIPE